MKITVLNGSPKGELSVTLQYARFLEKKKTKEFIADVHSPFARRYVADPKKVGRDLAERIRRVDYSPSSRFAL